MPAVALAALGALVALPALSQTRLYAAAPERFAYVTVAPGQNLWAIAEKYTPDNGSVQDTIDGIMAANGLENSTVIAGEHLKIPR
jgi:LysM repeat protein